MVVLGDLGAGKTTWLSFLAYHLARSFRAGPLRHVRAGARPAQGRAHSSCLLLGRRRSRHCRESTEKALSISFNQRADFGV